MTQIPRTFFLLLCLLFAANACFADDKQAKPEKKKNPDFNFPKSAEVHADGTVTFRLIAPNAKNVELIGSVVPKGQKRIRMEKSGKDRWKTTVGPLKPEIYSYSFSVDGTYTLDPHNRWFKGWRRSGNLLLVPGDPKRLWEIQNVPHGSVHHHTIHSESLGTSRDVFVYTPPGYSKTNDDYPVLYLLHGSGDDASAWTRVGRAHFIADNLIAERKMRPMVIVMPYGHAPANELEKFEFRDEWYKTNNRLMIKSFQVDCVPFVRQQYRISEQANETAIAGLSMGGGQALEIGLLYPEQFPWILAYSSGLPEKRGGIEERFAGVTESAKRKLLWIGCGKDDFLLKNNELFCQWLDEKNIEYQWLKTEGGHAWPVWREYLSQTLPLLFQSGEN